MIKNNEYSLSIEGLKKFERTLRNFEFPPSYLKIVGLGIKKVNWETIEIEI